MRKWLLILAIVLCFVAGGVYLFFYDGLVVIQELLIGEPEIPVIPESRPDKFENMQPDEDNENVDAANMLRSLDMEPYVTYDNLADALYYLSILYGNPENAATWSNNKSILSSKPDYYRERRVPRDVILRALYYTTGRQRPYYLPVELNSYSLGYMSGEEFMSCLEPYLDNDQLLDSDDSEDPSDDSIGGL